MPPQHAPQDAVPRMRRNVPATDHGWLRVLVVEDHWEAALTMGVLLEGWGCEVCTAHNGLEAVGMAEEFQPDVVLLDIGLPKLNGFELASHIRGERWGQAMTLIVVSAYGTLADKNRARQAGADHYMVKPVDPEALLKLLQSLHPSRAH
jgi:CheY-like chemotaxis protein